MDFCVPDTADWACAYSEEQIAELDPETKERAEILGWTTLASLTGYQVATCPIVVRPCTQGCMRGSYQAWPVVSNGVGTRWQPSINSQGFWVNSCGCGSPDNCSCTTLSEVILPGPVGGIVEVRVDGNVLDPLVYRVDQGNRLVALGDYRWPSCQVMNEPDTEEGTFSVRYWRGFAPNSLTNYAAGVLASEFYKACTSGKCRLPNGVTQVTRQGVTLEIQTGLWQGGWTGIREVDAIIATFNPYGLRAPTVVTSPDVRSARTTTWGW